ncbi:MAG: SDR family NAD(P)-dependent oxidoreductase, partial [Clostridiales bacterium]|nr:SDR family NAD(P)-dependent oxidoreductase [Clostridiales bacterium]
MTRLKIKFMTASGRRRDNILRTAAMPIGKGGFGMNKSVFVTGGTSGTGLAIAERFAKENYNVFIGSRSAESAQAAACEINKKY